MRLPLVGHRQMTRNKAKDVNVVTTFAQRFQLVSLDLCCCFHSFDLNAILAEPRAQAKQKVLFNV